MKKIILIAAIIGVLFATYFGHQFLSGAKAMMPSKDIKIPSIEKVANINDIVKPYIADQTTKGLSIGIYNKGQISYHNYGVCSDKNPVPPSNQSIYEIASITKTFTTAALAQMVKEGKVKYNDPIMLYLPKEVANWPNAVAITLEELATHQSGLPQVPSNYLKRAFFNIDNPYKNYSTQDLHNFLKSYTPIPKDQRSVVYSNLGMGLLGNILAQVADCSYEALIKKTITQPLNMQDTYAAYKAQTQIMGHNGYGEPTSQWEIPTLKGAGAIRSNTADMMQYLTANIQNKAPFATTHPCRADFGGMGTIGLGWLTIYPENTDLELYFHNGGTGGFRSAILFSKKQQIGIVALANSIQSVDALSIRIVELLAKQQATQQQSITQK